MATEQQTVDFILKIAPLMENEARKRGYRIVSTAIAQACVESAWGLSKLAKYHNYFGMKCGSSWKGKSVNMQTREEYSPGTLTTIRDNFRVYDSMEEGVKGYYDFISSYRYSNLKVAKTPEEYAKFLKADGYATSSSYVDTLMYCVSKHGLRRYDTLLTGATESEQNQDQEPDNHNPYKEPTKNIQLNSRGNDVCWLQYELNQRGYKLKVDGIARNLTIGALLDFQKKAGLYPDGICGSLTRAALKIK